MLAQNAMNGALQSAAELDMGGDLHRNVQVNARYRKPSFKHCLLPAWLGSYVYGGKRYVVVVNGVTGRVAGRAPTSVVKMGLVIAAAALLMFAPVLVGNQDLGWNAVTDPALEYTQHWLPRVSRSFAPSIAQLGEPLETPVGIAYLLCRVVDTIEDSEDLAKTERDPLFASFRRALLSADEADYFAIQSAEIFAPPQGRRSGS